jgi:hypothetical protein
MHVFWGYSIFASLSVPLALTLRNVNQATETAGRG